MYSRKLISAFKTILVLFLNNNKIQDIFEPVSDNPSTALTANNVLSSYKLHNYTCALEPSELSLILLSGALDIIISHALEYII